MVLLAEYRPPEWQVHSIDLDFRLDPEATQVINHLLLTSVAGSSSQSGTLPLRLFGMGFARYSLLINGQPPGSGCLVEDDEGLLLSGLPETVRLTIETWLSPVANTALEGLYVSGGCLCTQCEPEGFRRITFFPDRPDVLSIYRVRLEADRNRYPVLLANGNRVGAGELPGGRHFALWEDPFPKPSYLFALVAGDLVFESAFFRTVSGRDVQLEIYVEAHNRDRCAHALASLERAMRYDEEAFGREYDLGVYMIVAVDDFNMGAMENKGLNLFNAKYVLASPETATDDDYVAIESVIAHEYFHNWSGNRVTCRDWFQLSLKEGLTVFRDQEFTADCTLFEVKRIDDVQRLRAFQFPEDAGPLAHPVRPDRYAEINNFYTMTVYEKGAEVIRMLRTLLGRDRFRAGLDHYFERFDGQAVTVEDFITVMETVSGRDLSGFQGWYSQAGTPHVTVRATYVEAHGLLEIESVQFTPPTPGQTEKHPVPIPLQMALFAANGERLLVETGQGERTQDPVLELTETQQHFSLRGLREPPAAISWSRGFSAPIRIDAAQTVDALLLLLKVESDGFTRWDSAQELWRKVILPRVSHIENPDCDLETRLTTVYRQLIERKDIPPVLLSALLTPPTHREIAEVFERMDPVVLDQAIRDAERSVLFPLQQELFALRSRLNWADDASFCATEMGRRRLGNRLLTLLMALDSASYAEMVVSQYQRAKSQTVRMGALWAMNDHALPQRDDLLNDFEERFRHDPLVLDKWLSLQAASQVGDAFLRLETLMKHPAFRWTNPNRVRSILGPFMAQNYRHFHRLDGFGYQQVTRWLADLERINPQTAARLLQPFARWRRLDIERSRQMQSSLLHLQERQDLSRDFRDVLSRILA